MKPPLPVLALVLALVGCEAAGVRSEEAPGQQLKPAESVTATAKPGDITWGNTVAWRDWDAALRDAKAENKPLCIVVYADWCPFCKELAPEFEKPELASAAKGLIMVRQDQDEGAPWLKERFAAYGTYLPRVLFVDPSGNVREDLQSGHPRYPYFYAPLVSDRLLANMRAATRPKGTL